MHLTHLVHQAGETSLHQLSHEETSPRNQPAGFELFAMGLEFERAHVILYHVIESFLDAVSFSLPSDCPVLVPEPAFIFI